MTWELTPELEESILSQLEDGISLVKICLQPGVPSRRTVLKWMRENEAFSAKCAHARVASGERAAERMEEINELVMQGLLDPQSAKVVSSNLQWTASKLASKVYGDKTKVEHSGNISLAQLVEGSYSNEESK